jgi:D-alanyl-D-alanine carboxypeptidase (penicillin-binding protein 5/6)
MEQQPNSIRERTQAELQEKYRQQREKRKRQRKRQQAKLRLLLGTGIVLLLLLLLVLRNCMLPSKPTVSATNDDTAQLQSTADTGWISVGQTQFKSGLYADSTANTITLDDSNILSAHAILIDESNNTIIAQKDAKAIISPASMTKILTVLVAAEHLQDASALDDPFTITLEMTDYAYQNKCSTAGFLNEETVTVRDLFYGTILPSGGEAAAALAIYTAGSLDDFATLMNEKLEQLGLAETAHFTNSVGLYDEAHYCTVYDMAMILKAALANDICRDVLGARTYTTSVTAQHPEGILLSNWFLRRIEDKETGGTVLGAKTGFVVQSGNCAASYFVSDSGTPYICVTANTYSSWRCIYDHVAMYSLYAP